MGFKNFLSIFYLMFLMLWFWLGATLAFNDPSTLEAFGFGVASGVFLKGFSDMWQFWWRKSPKNAK